MLKLFGAILVLAAGTMFGFVESSHLVRRPRQIRELTLAFQRLETEIIYGSTLLPEALRSAARPLSPPLAAVFLDAASHMTKGPAPLSAEESWVLAVEDGWRNTSMKADEKETVRQLGFSLGISDREDQVKHIRLAVHQLQAGERTALEEQKRYETMWKSLGVLSAALVVILMF